MAPMSDPSRGQRFRDLATRAGIVVSAFTVFTAGWVAMRSDDWRIIAAVTVLALVAGLLAANLTARQRRR